MRMIVFPLRRLVGFKAATASVPVHANNTGHWRAEKFPVAQDCSCMSRRVFARDSHRTVDLSAQLVAEMLKRRGQGRNIWWPTLGFVDQGGDEGVPGCSRCEHHMP